MERYSGCQIPSGVQAWDGICMWGQYQEEALSSNFYVFSGLSRKVCPYLSSSFLTEEIYRVLIANICNLGGCPCPRCLIPKAKFQDVATEDDMLQHDVLVRRDMAERHKKILCARQLIYEGHYVINTPQVEALLKAESLVPTTVCFPRLSELVVLSMIVKNAFAERLGPTGFDFFRMLVVDLLHEFELGVWKSILVHLLRILDSLKGTVLTELDHR